MNVKKCKGIAALLAVVMTVMMFSGCAGGKSGKSAAVNLDGEIPENLTIFTNLGSNIPAAGGSTFNDCLSFQMLEEKTGCHVEWIHPASGAATERFNMMMVSGEYPDAIVYNWGTAPGGIESYVEDEVIVDLTPYIEKCMPNFWKILEENPEFKRDVETDDGKIYAIPYINIDKELGKFQGPVIRQDWLDKLGLEVPTNADELYEVLKAFKTQDPNGNGKADEIPMGGNKLEMYNGIGSLLWMFGAHWTYQIQDNKVVYGPMTENFKEGLAYMAKLYSEGLIDPDYLLDTRAKVDAKFTSDQMGFIYGYQPTTYYSSMNDGKRVVAGIPFFYAADGKNYTFNNNYTQLVKTATSLAISTANENVAGTLKWLDVLFSEEGIKMTNFGKEGLTYEMVDGKAVYTDYVKNPTNGKTSAQMIALNCAVRDTAFPMAGTWQYYKQSLAPWGIQAVETWEACDPYVGGIVPPISRTTEEGETYSEIMNVVDTYMLEAVNKIVTGKESIDSWDATVEQFKSMGIEEAIEIQNAAYKRYLAR